MRAVAARDLGDILIIPPGDKSLNQSWRISDFGKIYAYDEIKADAHEQETSLLMKITNMYIYMRASVYACMNIIYTLYVYIIYYTQWAAGDVGVCFLRERASECLLVKSDAFDGYI